MLRCCDKLLPNSAPICSEVAECLKIINYIMKLHESIKVVLSQLGYQIMTEKAFVNALGDFGAFSEVPSSKQVIKDIIAEGYAEKIERIWSIGQFAG